MKLLATLALALPLTAAAQYDPATPPEPWSESAAAPAAAPQAAPPPSGAAQPTPSGPTPAVAPQEATPPAPAPSAWPSPAQPAAGAPPAYPANPPRAYPAAYPPPPASPRYARRQQRGPWYIGFGIGSGDGSITSGGETHSFSYFGAPNATSIGLNFKVGATLNSRTLLGFDAGAHSAQGDASGVSTNVQVSYYNASVLYFPNERGFFLRAGAGPCALSIDLDEYGKNTWRGFDVIGGVGYAWWIGQTFNLTFNLEGSRQWYSGATAPESSQFWNAYLGFDWY